MPTPEWAIHHRRVVQGAHRRVGGLVPTSEWAAPSLLKLTRRRREGGRWSQKSWTPTSNSPVRAICGRPALCFERGYVSGVG